MAVDMTNETIAQYRERIEKMSIKEIQKEIEFLESPGYNCEGLVCADGVITPRTRMLRKVLWEKRMNQKSQTALQWAKEGYAYSGKGCYVSASHRQTSTGFRSRYRWIQPARRHSLHRDGLPGCKIRRPFQW